MTRWGGGDGLLGHARTTHVVQLSFCVCVCVCARGEGLSMITIGGNTFDAHVYNWGYKQHSRVSLLEISTSPSWFLFVGKSCVLFPKQGVITLYKRRRSVVSLFSGSGSSAVCFCSCEKLL
jgi:hypothetical protein